MSGYDADSTANIGVASCTRGLVIKVDLSSLEGYRSMCDN